MKTRFFILSVFFVCIFTAGASADSTPDTDVLGFDASTDYMSEIIDAVEDGSFYAKEMARVYEAQRNLKIDSLGLDYEKTDLFADGADIDEVRERLDEYLSPSSGYRLTDYERDMVERAVMAEAGGESYTGQMMVAQAILDGAQRNGLDVVSSIRKYQVVVSSGSASSSVCEAVAAVFDGGERVTEAKADLWYSPSLCSSPWHESQIYITTIGCHRFFWMRS